MIIDSWPLYETKLAVHFLLFFAAPVFLFMWRWPFSAGLTMLLSTALPLLGQVLFTDSEMPGFAFLLMFEVPVALIVFVVGTIISISSRLRSRPSTSRL